MGLCRAFLTLSTLPRRGRLASVLLLLALLAATAAGCVDGGRGLRVSLRRRRPARRGADRRLPQGAWCSGEGVERQRCAAVAGAAIELDLKDAAEQLHYGLRGCTVKRATPGVNCSVQRRECSVRRRAHKSDASVCSK